MAAMTNQTEAPEILADDFVRRFSQRKGQLMWLLGAGVSASANIITAWDMIWRFKQTLFITQRRVPASSVADLSNVAIRRMLDAHVASNEAFPPSGAPEEYAALFEAVYPAEKDRRSFIDTMIEGAKPSFGHLALAALCKADFTQLIWTTNFDHLLADACATAYGTTSRLSSISPDSPEQAPQLIGEQRWPIEIKLHGDFRSRRLKNTSEELRQQDRQLRQMLIDSGRGSGLIVAGYSGRDQSLMDALENAIEQPAAMPGGLFWLHRGHEAPLARVSDLISRAAAKGLEAVLVRIESFDELMRDLVRPLDDLDTGFIEARHEGRQWWSAAPAPSAGRGWPVIRLNAVEIKSIPSQCRRIVCDVGGTADVRRLVAEAGVDVIAARSKAGVLAFGRDDDLKRVFTPFDEFDLHAFENKRLRWESAERGILRDALSRALGDARGLEVVRRRSADLLAPIDCAAEQWAGLRRLVERIDGQVPGHAEIRWREGVAVRLEWADERLWLVLDPRLIFDGVTDDTKAAVADFSRERTVRRYNPAMNNLVAFWSAALAGRDLRSLAIGDGIDARFTVGRSNAFSARAKA